MKAIRNGILCVMLACGFPALADEAGERAFHQAVERFERLHIFLQETVERGGIEDNEPMDREIEELFEALQDVLAYAAEARSERPRESTLPDTAAAIPGRYAHFNQLLNEVGGRPGALEPGLLDEMATRFWRLMEPVGDVLGVHRGDEERPGHFDVTARIVFSIEGVGEPVTIATAVPHYSAKVIWREEVDEEEVSALHVHFEVEGDLHPAAERWYLRCVGEFRVSEEEAQTNKFTQVTFDASTLLRPGAPSLLVGNDSRKLWVTLWLDDEDPEEPERPGRAQ